MVMLRARRDHYTLFQSEGLVHGLVVESKEGDRRLCYVTYFKSLLADRSIATPFGRRLNRSGKQDTPPMAGSNEEAMQTARVVGYPGGLGSCMRREEEWFPDGVAARAVSSRYRSQTIGIETEQRSCL
jgi:hypothetical protein